MARPDASAAVSVERFFQFCLLGLVSSGYLAVAVVWWQLSLWVAVVYAGMSVVTFALYAMDKRRAQAGEWRVSEATLQLAALGCGWPGAVLAQQFLRHKNRKRSFQALFWALVVLNTVVLAVVVHGTSVLR